MSGRRGKRAADAAVIEAQNEAERCRQTHGDDAPETQKAMMTLARAYLIARDFPQAKATDYSVYLMRRAKYGEEKAAATTFAISAGCLAEEGDLIGARELQERILRANEADRGPESASTAQAMVNLAITLSLMGDDEGAKVLHDRAVLIFETTLGDDHPTTQWARDQLAMTEYTPNLDFFRWAAVALALLGLVFWLVVGAWAFGLGLAAGAFVLSEGFRTMRQGKRFKPRPGAVDWIRASLGVGLSAGGAVVLLVLAPQNKLAQGLGGILTALAVMGIIVNVHPRMTQAMARRRMD